MNEFTHSPFEPQLEMVATVAGGAIEASINDLRQQDRLTIAIRDAVRGGVSIEALSEASGLPIREVQRRLTSDLFIENELDALAGVR